MTSPRLRDDLQALEGYHSAQVEVDIRLNTNESPFPPPPAFFEELVELVGEISLNRYPDRAARELRAKIASLHGVDWSEVFAANGSNEVLQSLLLAYGGPGRRALVFEPSYALHAHIARTTGTEVVSVDRTDDFELPVELLVNAIKDVDPAITFVCSPNNPTGGVSALDTIEAALAAGDGLVVVDEAYGQFAQRSALELGPAQPTSRLVVVRTFSKTWAMAGARLGYLVAAPAIVASLETVVLPYHLSALTQAAGLAILGHGEEMKTTVAKIVEERGRLLAELRELDLEVWPSQANFILFRPRSREGHDVWLDLVDRSVLVRDCSSWARLEGCLRVTIGTHEENGHFLAALKEAL